MSCQRKMAELQQTAEINIENFDFDDRNSSVTLWHTPHGISPPTSLRGTATPTLCSQTLLQACQ